MDASTQQTQTNTGDPNVHVTVNGILLLILGGLSLFAGLIAFIATFATGAFVDQWDPTGAAAFWTRFGGIIALITMLFFALPALLAGIGLLKRQEWGRILALVVAALNALFGLTLFGGNFLALLNLGWAVYAFWSLTRPEVVALFGTRQQQQQVIVQA